MKKFIRVADDFEVKFTHYMPFDETHGLGKTKEELLKEGYLVDEVPEPEFRESYIAKRYYDKEKNKIYYEYIKKTHR